MLDLIAFDADDTLWHTEHLYSDAQERLQQLLAPYGLTEQIEQKLDSVAFRAMYAMARDDSEWPAPYLWTGAVPYFGAPSIAGRYRRAAG